MWDGGREGRIIPSEYMMNVAIGLKLTWGGGKWWAESKSVRVRHGEYHRRLAAARLSQSLCPQRSETKPKGGKAHLQLPPLPSEEKTGDGNYIEVSLFFFFFNTLLKRLQHLGPCTQVEEEAEEERG